MTSGEIARTDLLDPKTRVRRAVADLQEIAVVAQEQLELEDCLKATNTEVLLYTESIFKDTPYRPELNEALELLTMGSSGKGRPIGEAIDEMRKDAGDRDARPIDEGSIKRDVLATLHPDKKITSNDQDDHPMGGFDPEEHFKAVTSVPSRLSPQTQLRYAHVVGTLSSAPKTAGADILDLERSRYKAWVALQAGKTRFKNAAEIAEWAESEKARAPYNIAAGDLVALHNIFMGYAKANESSAAVQSLAESINSIGERLRATVDRLRDQQTPQGRLYAIDLKFGSLLISAQVSLLLESLKLRQEGYYLSHFDVDRLIGNFEEIIEQFDTTRPPADPMTALIGKTVLSLYQNFNNPPK